jgi:hypothetical protein
VCIYEETCGYKEETNMEKAQREKDIEREKKQINR